MTAIFFALISFFGWAVGDIFGTIASRKVSSIATAISRSVFGVILFSFYIPFAVSELKNFHLSILPTIMILSFVGSAGIVIFYEGLRLGNSSIVGAIAGSFPVVTVILSLVFFGERLTFNQVIAISIILGGFILTSLDFKSLGKKRLKLDRGIIFAILAMILWGVYFAFVRIPVSKIGWFWPGYIGNIFAIIGMLIYGAIKGFGITKTNIKKSIIPMIGNGLLLTAGEFAYNIAIGFGKTSIVAPIAGSYPALFVVLSFLFLKDKINKHQIGGVIMTILGIVLLSLFSV